jgi:superfamily II DNA or RNA helicase
MHHFLAYIDPGSGSLIIQAVIASIVAIPFFFRQQIGRFVRTVRRTDQSDVTESRGSSEQPDRPS